MTVRLVERIPASYADVSDFKKFFDKDERNKISKVWEPREQAPPKGCKSCTNNLFFGFFFDGTKNNYTAAEATRNHSNVARLYECFPGQSVEGVLNEDSDWTANKARYTHFFRVYIPGVASKFEAVFDKGEGWMQIAGAGGGFMGESRIAWALIQAINNVNRYFVGEPVISSKKASKYAHDMRLTAHDREMMLEPGLFDKPSMRRDCGLAGGRLGDLLEKLHGTTSRYWPTPDGRPRYTGPGMVEKIHISVFGFSRGATEARAFTNWLRALCELDGRLSNRPGRLTLGGFDVEFDFLGLFDTVASVGVANTLGNMPVARWIDGHGGWADAEDSLRIKGGTRCVHLVAAHEIRRSFPVDSIAVGNSWPDNSEEIVFPGVHSDVGGGYCPREQGRGVDEYGSDMLSRIPLIYMYKQARLAGVPLKLELATDAVKRRFKVDPKVIESINAYLAACKPVKGTITDIMREQAKMHMLWRRARRASGSAPISSTGSFARATNFDKNDLHSANLDFEDELKMFEKFRRMSMRERVAEKAEPGFDNQHEQEWHEIAGWWGSSLQPSGAVMSFFDEYVHDSRAWFKLIPGHPDTEKDALEALKKASERRKYIAAWNKDQSKLHVDYPNSKPRLLRRTNGRLHVAPGLEENISPEKAAALDEYERTRQIPRMRTYGREPFDSSWASFGLGGKGGYLRYRKVYGGSDEILLSSNEDVSTQSRFA